MKIVEASKQDTEKLGLILASVFEEHPFYHYVTDDPERRRRMAIWMTRRIIAYGLAYGTVFTDEDRIGTSVIMPTDRGAITIPRLIRLGLWQTPFKMGWGGFRKFLKFSSQTEEIRKGLMEGEHYLQLTVGVNPDVQGAGIGSALLQAGIEVAENAGQDAYAETMLENVVGDADRRAVVDSQSQAPRPHRRVAGEILWS